MGKNGLKGKKVAILRSLEQSNQLAAEIKQEGGVPIFAPSIEISLDYDPQEVERIFHDLSDGSINYLIFTSSNGVRSFYQIAAERRQDSAISTSVKIIAIGPWTAEALARHGVLDVTIPEEFSNAGILNLLSKLDIKGRRITLLRGSRSDNTLPTRLEAQGANVDSVKVYRTSLTHSERMTDLIEMITLGRVDIILFSSPSTVRSFLDSVSRQDLDVGILDKIVVAAIGPVTGNYLRERGVQVTVESNTFEIGGLLESIGRYLDGNAKAK